MSPPIECFLTEENIILYAIKAYDKPNAVMSEFEQDYKRVKYLKRLFRKYKKTGILKERLILNHLIILYNVFGQQTTKILFFKIDHKDYDLLKTFLIFINRCPTKVIINGHDLRIDEIPIILKVSDILRKI